VNPGAKRVGGLTDHGTLERRSDEQQGRIPVLKAAMTTSPNGRGKCRRGGVERTKGGPKNECQKRGEAFGGPQEVRQGATKGGPGGGGTLVGEEEGKSPEARFT